MNETTELILNYYSKGVPVEDIAMAVGASVAYVESVISHEDSKGLLSSKKKDLLDSQTDDISELQSLQRKIMKKAHESLVGETDIGKLSNALQKVNSVKNIEEDKLRKDKEKADSDNLSINLPTILAKALNIHFTQNNQIISIDEKSMTPATSKQILKKLEGNNE